MPKLPHLKTYKTIDECLDMMLMRGMVIPDMDFARRMIERPGYYRLSAFYYPFRAFCEVPGEADKVRCDRFRDGTRFDDVVAFYLWDKRVPLEITDAIERIEIALRAAIVEVLGALNPQGHRDPRSYKPEIREPNEQGDVPIDLFASKLEEAFRRSKEEYAKHFKRRYSGSPPIWIEAGTWDWGNMAFILRYLNDRRKDEIAARIHPDLPRSVMESWVNALNDVRNDCAHHSRIWNKNLINSPGIPKGTTFAEFQHLRGRHAKGAAPTQKLYGALVVMAFLIKQFHRTRNGTSE
ncbi:Abi family protein [Primorskyibacter sp. 2E233]